MEGNRVLLMYSNGCQYYKIIINEHTKLNYIFEGPDIECDKKCENNGWCNADKICQCPEGYMGQYCKTALCYPQCMNNGTCVAPGVCRCPQGFQGPHCEGGNVMAFYTTFQKI